MDNQVSLVNEDVTNTYLLITTQAYDKQRKFTFEREGS